MPAGVHPSIRDLLARLVGGRGVRATDDDIAHCGECGYQLEGLLDPASPGLCPECGGSFNPFAPHRPWTRRQWLGFLLGGCGPTLMLLAIAWGSTMLDDERMHLAIGIVGPFWVFMLAYAALVWPALWTNLRKDDRSRPERRRMLLSSYAIAILPVAVLVMVSLV